MTPSLLRSTRALAQLNAATGLVTQKGASALTRQSSLTDVQRMRARAVTKRSSNDERALGHGQKRKRDDGDGSSGVGR